MFRLTLRSIASSLLAAVVALTVLGSTVSAFAAAGPWETIDLTLIQANDQGMLLVTGVLPKDEKLPATVYLALPKDAKIEWAGEIVGTDPSKDPKVAYEVQKGDQYDLVQFTMSKARVAQVEAFVPKSLTTSGTAGTASIDWVAPFDIPAVRMGVQVPQGGTVPSPPKGAQKDASGGDNYYSRTVAPVSAGERLQFALEFTGASTPSAGTLPGGQPGIPPAPSAPTSGSSSSSLILGILVIGAVLGGLFFYMRRSEAAREEEFIGDDDESVPAERSNLTGADGDGDEDGFDAFDSAK